MKKRVITLLLSFTTLLYANGIVVEPGRNQNVQLDKAANGVPLINIETPNEKGLSHNVFRDYNVDQKGVLLNNALEVESSKLGGLIYGNPNLQQNRKEASTILTEVSGVNRSKIEGFTEIVGKQADYILANPNGIYIDGAGFINTGNVQLSTGSANHLQNPEKGQIEIAGKGLDVRNNNKAELIARTAILTAPIYGGEEVRLQLGSQAAKEKPELALDARNLGSIYAGKINIISNEEGVGVKSAATIYASTGDVILDSKGKAYVQEVQAKKDIRMQAKESEVADKLLAEGKVVLQNESLFNRGNISANEGIEIKGDLENQGILRSNQNIKIESKNLTNREKILTKGNLAIQSTHLINAGKLEAEGAIRIQADTLQNEKMLGKDLEIHAKKIENKNQILAKETLKIAGDEFQNANIVYSGKNTNIQGNRMENVGEVSSDGSIQIHVNTIESRSMRAKDRLQMQSKNLLSKERLHAEKDVHIQSDSVENQGDLLSGNDLSIQSDRLINRKNILGKNAVNIVTKSFENDATQGMIYSENQGKLKADTIELTKNIAAKNTLSLETKKLKRADSYSTNSDLHLYVDGEYSNAYPLLGKNLSLRATNLENKSILASQGTLDLLGTEKIQNHKNSLLYSANTMTLVGGSLENRGDIFSKQDANLRFSGDVENLTANLQAEESMRIQAKNFRNKGHLTGNYSAKWVEGSRSNIDVSKLPKAFLAEIDGLLEKNRRGRKFRGWDEPKRLARAQEGISHYVSHKSYVKSGKDLFLEVEKEVLNQEADMLAGGNMEIKADTLTNTREGKEIDISLEFARRYHYRHTRWNGSHTTKHDDIYARKTWKETLYADKPTQIIAGGNLRIQATKIGNGEEKRNTSSENKTIDSPLVGSNVGTIDASFRVNNNSLVDTIKKESAITVKEYLEIPSNEEGMFVMRKRKDNPKFSYLIETNPKLTQREFYLGSDYFFSRIGFNPDRDIRLLGDSFYEHRLLSKAILEGTGKRYLYSSDGNAERKALFDGAIAAQKELELSLGVSLSKEQINRLKQDILWYVEEEVAGEKVLVPRLYLSKNTLKEIQEKAGNHIQAGGNLQIDVSALDNDGKIAANKNISIQAKNILQNAAYENTGMYGNNISLFAEETIENVGGKILAEGDIALVSKEGKIRNEKKLSVHENNLRNIFTDERGSGEIQGKNIQILAKQVENVGADMTAKENLEIGAQESLQIGSLEAVDQKVRVSKKRFEKDRNTQNVASNLRAKNIRLDSLGEIGMLGSNLVADEDISMRAKKDISIVAGKNTSLHEERQKSSKSFGRSSERVDISYQEEVIPSAIKAKNVTIGSHDNIHVVGSKIVAEKDANFISKGDINILATNRGSSEVQQKTKTGFLKLSGQSSLEDSLQYESIASHIQAGKEANFIADKNIRVLASNISSQEDINLSAKENINILAGDHIQKQKKEEKKYKTSLFATLDGWNIEAGIKANMKNSKEGTYQTNAAISTLQAEKEIHLQSGKDTSIQAATILSENTYSKAGGNLNIIEKEELFTRDTTNQEMEAKVSAALKLNGIKDTLQSVVQVTKGVKELPKMVTLAKDLASGKEMNEALEGKEKAMEEANLIANGPKKGEVGAGIYAGAKISKNKESIKGVTSVGSHLESKDTIALKSGEDMKLQNVEILSKNIVLDAAKNISIEAGKSKQESKGSSWGANGEVNLLTGQFNLGGNVAKDRVNSEIYNNSKMIGENVSIMGKDLLVKGANIEGEKVRIAVENLQVESLQDKEKARHQGYNLSLGNSSVGAGLEYGKKDKAWVNKQTSIVGKEESNIIVKEKTTLIGSVLGGKNTTLKTKELEFSDIEDKEKGYNIGLDGSLNFSKEKEKTKTSKQAEVNYDAVDKKQVNRATIGEGSILVDGKETDLAINRDESKAQEITKEISVDRIGIEYRDNTRKWADVSDIMGEQGATLGKDLDQILGKNYNLEEKLSSAFQETYLELEKVLDQELKNEKLGIVPTKVNEGGIAGEFQNPSLLVGKGANNVVVQYVSKGSKDGKMIVDALMKQMTDEEFKKYKESNNEKILYTNGVLNVASDFAEGLVEGTFTAKEMERLKNGETITRIGNFSPSNGILADGLECVIGTLGLFANLNLAGKDLVKIYKERPDLLENNVIAHSQGTIKTTAALKALAKEKEGRELIKKHLKNLTFVGTAITPGEYKKLEKTLHEINPEIKIESYMNRKDLVSILLGNKANTTGKKHPVSNYNKEHFKDLNKDGIYQRKQDEFKKKIPSTDVEIGNFNGKNGKNLFRRGEDVSE